MTEIDTSDLVPIGSVRPDPENARRHPDHNLSTIRNSLERFGQQKPIVVGRDGEIIAGNGTYAAAVDLGWKSIRVSWSDLTGAEARAYALADNRSGDLSFFDPDDLHDQLEFLGESGIDLDSLGFGFDDEDDSEQSEDESKVKFKEHSTLPPPDMAWVLIGIPTVRFGELQRHIDVIVRIPGVLCESVLNARDEENGQP